MVEFRPYGPFVIPRENGLIDHINLQERFWEKIGKYYPGLSNACGCYIFALSPSGGSAITPWYVGKARKSSFSQECFSHHKLTLFNSAIAKYEKVTAYLFLLARVANNRKLSAPSGTKNGHRDISVLEKRLIQEALRVNRDIKNTAHAEALRGILIPGLDSGNGRMGPPLKEVRALKKLLQIK